MAPHIKNQTLVSEIFNESNIFQSYLDVESALARAQASQGIIPLQAAEIITENAKLELLELQNIYDGLDKTGHPLVPLIWELDRVCGEEAGGYIHWGATTQNITQTGKILLIKKCHDSYLRDLGNLLHILGELAEETKDYAMPGRTHGQHAVPATFGYKVAVWIDELIRHTDRLEECEGRIFVAMLGGGAGTMASVGIEGLETQRLIGKELGLGSMTMPSRVIGDHLTEYITLLAMLAATASKISREIYIMMKQEFGEVEEPVPVGAVGSSTMPQKRNPRLCQSVIAWASEIRTFVPMSLEAMQTEHEADAATSVMINSAIDRTCVLMGQITNTLIEIFSGLKVFPDRMRENLDLSGGLILSERIMLELGHKMGRQKAHDAVYEAAQRSVNEQRAFTETLQEEPDVANQLTKEEILGLLDPEQYTGLSSYFAHEFSIKAEQRSQELLVSS
ncbi:MAG: adenylosuccinate lyase [Chloroflexi bacterium]|nr:adenylosuccinate lyase [Chloroflexota bacterium]|tara:strand:- start:9308 stop:10657 length:1350 start_codon:yes stop_codon:yes gene_type:complete